MNEITRLTLENEMDLVVAHKRCVSVCEYLKLTLTTQITFATAIVEASREVIDKTDAGYLVISLEEDNRKYFVTGTLFFDAALPFSENDAGMEYAKKLVPSFQFTKDGAVASVALQIGIPRSVRLNNAIVSTMRTYFAGLKPATPYEELKARNNALSQRAIEQDERLQYSKLLDEKKNEFISTASHELRTPLTSILAFSEMALSLSEEECNVKVRRLVERIHVQAGKLNTLIYQLLNVSKMEAGRLEYTKEEFSLSDYIGELADLLTAIHPRHRIHVSANNSRSLIYADKLRLEQVLTNLVGNAAKYSKPGTTIQVSMDEQPGGTLHIGVTDEGIGMSEESTRQVFDKFYRDETVAKTVTGLGLGLFITRNIVEEHGGRIWVQSDVGKGSTFTFSIPIVQKADTESV